ncbi:MAG TPA: shikimate kinase [Chitinophagales bacterium]|nr:shikimate kinase [Chitinophagales bacterium]
MNINTRIFLIGLMGSGKTFWGEKIARLLGWKFIDLDSYIEEREKKSIPEIFERFGENHFRNLETKYLHELGSLNKIVVAAGGGTPCFNNNMEWMNQSGETYFLKISPETAAGRLKNQISTRPLLRGKNHEELILFLTKQLKEREQYYRMAKHIVDGEKLDDEKG